MIQVFKTLVLRLSSTLRVILFLLVVALILSYVASRRPRNEYREGQLPPVTPPAGPTLALPAAPPQAEYFTEHRLEREANRQHQLELIRALIDHPNTDASTRQEAGRKLLRIVDQIGRELRVEGLIRAKGYEDSLVFLGDTSATVVVKSPELKATDVARIADIVMRKTGLGQEAITIVARP